MKKLMGGYDTNKSRIRLYNLDNEIVLTNGDLASEEILERLANFMYLEKSYLDFKFFKHINEYYCECVTDADNYEAFVCGYGATEGEAFQNCNAILDILKEKYIDLE